MAESKKAESKKAERFKAGDVVRVAGHGSPSIWRGRPVKITTVDPATAQCEALYDVVYPVHRPDSEVNFFDSELEPLERHGAEAADGVRLSIASKLRALADEIEGLI